MRFYSFNLQYIFLFRLEDENEYKFPVCVPENKAQSENISPVYGNYNGSSQFYVFVGVIAMLYAILALAFYVLADPIYHSNPLFPKLVHIRFLFEFIKHLLDLACNESRIVCLGPGNICGADASLAGVVRRVGRVRERHELLQRVEPRLRASGDRMR